MPGDTRCDCLTDEYAIEFDFGYKWAESIDQSLYYALQTGRKPGVVLILENPHERRYWIRLHTVLRENDINAQTWKMAPDDL